MVKLYVRETQTVTQRIKKAIHLGGGSFGERRTEVRGSWQKQGTHVGESNLSESDQSHWAKFGGRSSQNGKTKMILLEKRNKFERSSKRKPQGVRGHSDPAK